VDSSHKPQSGDNKEHQARDAKNAQNSHAQQGAYTHGHGAAKDSGSQHHAADPKDRPDRKLFIKRPKPLQGIRDFVAKRRPSIDEVVHETTSGGIVFRHNKDTDKIEILLIQDAKNRWTIPKGHVEEGEEPKQTAEREINEETGLQEMKVFNWLGKVNFRYRRTHTLVLMTMHIYLVQGLGETDTLAPEDWLTDIKWFPAHEAVDKIAYDDIGKLILIGMKKIRDNKL
jgi:8-oxo-dGTP pyrophosphatase MutT (NUDIX family)